jgi:UDP-3-O-[3-hydroxymyristoyl] glucosamine N-acyltransferase
LNNFFNIFFMTAKTKTLAELAAMVDGELTEKPEMAISGLADLASAEPGEISFLVKSSGLDRLEKSRASAFIVPQSLEYAARPLIRVRNPYLAAARIQTFFKEKPFEAKGISPRAEIG